MYILLNYKFKYIFYQLILKMQNRERIVSSTVVSGKSDVHMQKTVIGLLSYTIHKNQLKKD